MIDDMYNGNDDDLIDKTDFTLDDDQSNIKIVVDNS